MQAGMKIVVIVCGNIRDKENEKDRALRLKYC